MMNIMMMKRAADAVRVTEAAAAVMEAAAAVAAAAEVEALAFTSRVLTQEKMSAFITRELWTTAPNSTAHLTEISRWNSYAALA